MMALLRDKDRDALRDLANEMTRDVDVTLYTQRESALAVPGVVQCQTCDYAEQLLTELGEVIPRLKTRVVDLVEARDEAEAAGVVRVPTMLVGGAAENRVRFVGFPGGYEASTFIKCLIDAGGEPEADAKETGATLSAAVSGPVDIKVFVTPT